MISLSLLLARGEVLNNSARLHLSCYPHFGFQTPSEHCDHEPLDKAVSLMLGVELRKVI